MAIRHQVSFVQPAFAFHQVGRCRRRRHHVPDEGIASAAASKACSLYAVLEAWYTINTQRVKREAYLVRAHNSPCLVTCMCPKEVVLLLPLNGSEKQQESCPRI